MKQKLNVDLIDWIVYYLIDDYTPILRFVSKDWKSVIDEKSSFYKKHVSTMLNQYRWFEKMKNYNDVVLWILNQYNGQSFCVPKVYWMLSDLDNWEILDAMMYIDKRKKNQEFWYHIFHTGIKCVVNNQKEAALWCYFNLKKNNDNKCVKKSDLQMFLKIATYHQHKELLDYEKSNQISLIKKL